MVASCFQALVTTHTLTDPSRSFRSLRHNYVNYPEPDNYFQQEQVRMRYHGKAKSIYMMT